MQPLFEVKAVDREFYERRLRDFLPPRMIDIHTHVWLARLKTRTPQTYARVVKWPSLVAKESPIEELLETYRLMFPEQQVTPMIFASVKPTDDIDALNAYIRDSARAHQVPALLYTRPDWTAELFESKVREGGFLGAKVYLDLAPSYIPTKEIRILDFLPPHLLEVLDRNGWIAMLHVPRDGRLRDPVNIAQMLHIEEYYPNVRLIVAHVGRAYCNEDVGDAFEKLAGTQKMLFDISANSNDWVFEQLIRAVGPKRILFGSDLPILRMRTHRICENGMYINLVPKGLYGDTSVDPHLREVEGQEAERLTFFMYEEIDAFRRAAERTGLTDADIEDVFYHNARQLLDAVRV